jgi:signal transduction histidine kinase
MGGASAGNTASGPERESTLDIQPMRILLIEDDEDDYILTRDLLAEIDVWRYSLDWKTSFQAGLEAIATCDYDVCLLDYRLGEHNGLELLRRAVGSGCKTPVIFLTGQGDYEVDVEAMRAGAADYLIKGQITAPLLERSIRYSIERKRSEQALKESENQLRHLSTQLIAAQENERKRIAGELHDSVGQCLSAIKFSVESSLLQMEQGVVKPESLSAVVPLVQRAMEEVRRMMADLRPSILDDLGILATIGWFCREYNKVYPEIKIKRDITIAEEDVPDGLKIVIFRLIQEALHNVAKHSNARGAAVSLRRTPHSLELAIEDKGQGFVFNKVFQKRNPGECFGLTNMKERTELSGGVFIIKSEEGKGTSVKASWFLSRER